jgi:sulfur-oxidizing protein SoxB
VAKPAGHRIGDLTLLRTGQPIEAEKDYVVAGWASVNENTEGPPIWDIVMAHIRKEGVVRPADAPHVRLLGT